MPISFPVWTVVFAIVAYVIAIDDNILLFLTLYWKRVRILLSEAILKVKIHPETPWMEMTINKNAELNAKIIAKELGLDKNDDWNE